MLTSLRRSSKRCNQGCSQPHAQRGELQFIIVAQGRGRFSLRLVLVLPQEMILVEYSLGKAPWGRRVSSSKGALELVVKRAREGSASACFSFLLGVEMFGFFFLLGCHRYPGQGSTTIRPRPWSAIPSPSRGYTVPGDINRGEKLSMVGRSTVSCTLSGLGWSGTNQLRWAKTSVQVQSLMEGFHSSVAQTFKPPLEAPWGKISGTTYVPRMTAVYVHGQSKDICKVSI